MIKTIFFDLFFTLITPTYFDKDNEYDILNLTSAEWEKYAENDLLYQDRAMGHVKTEKEIINAISDIMPYKITDYQKQEILVRREKRMKNALLNVNAEILDTLQALKDKHIKICIISNADIIDKKYWDEGILASYFDEAVFSCDVGLLKPDIKIYEYAIQKMGASPIESIFVGDGGSQELYGAKKAGMQTVFTEFLIKKDKDKKEEIMKYSDYDIDHFYQLMSCVK